MLNPPPQRGRVAATEPDRRPWLLERLGLHRRVVKLPEPPLERGPPLGPQGLHDLQTFIEPRNQAAGIYAESRELPEPPSSADAHLEAASAELVQCAQALGQVNRAVQRSDEHRAPQTQAVVQPAA
jgi:hypothetical protein